MLNKIRIAALFLALTTVSVLNAQTTLYPAETTPASGSTVAVNTSVDVAVTLHADSGCFAGCVNLTAHAEMTFGDCGTKAIYFDTNGTVWTPGFVNPWVAGNCTVRLTSGNAWLSSGMLHFNITYNATGTFNLQGLVSASGCCDENGDGWSWTSGLSTVATYTYIIPNNAPVVVSVSGLGANLYYGLWFQPTIICRDPDGVGNIASCRVIIGYGVDDTYTCDLIYLPNSNQIGLLNDARSDWQLRTPGSGGSVGNTYCQLDATGSSAFNNGTDTTWYPRIYFKPAVISAGKYLVGSWMLVMDSPGATAGWSQMTSVTTMVRPSPRLTIVNQH